MRFDYESRFGPANPDRLDGADAGLITFTQEKGWLVPEDERPADWRERTRPKPITPETPSEFAHVHRAAANPPKPPRNHVHREGLEEKIRILRREGRNRKQIAEKLGLAIGTLGKIITAMGPAEKHCVVCQKPTGRRPEAKYCATCQPKARAAQMVAFHQRRTGA